MGSLYKFDFFVSKSGKVRIERFDCERTGAEQDFHSGPGVGAEGGEQEEGGEGRCGFIPKYLQKIYKINEWMDKQN